MPTLADRDSLPYICATVQEALRWRPALPLGESLPKTTLMAEPHLWLVKHSITPLHHGGKSLLISRPIYFSHHATFPGRLVDGFFIPKGTICLANIWFTFKFAFLCFQKPDFLSMSMNRDPTIYVGGSMVSAGNCLISTLC